MTNNTIKEPSVPATNDNDKHKILDYLLPYFSLPEQNNIIEPTDDDLIIANKFI